MARSSRPRSLLLFYILVGYVTLQFLWWAWHIIDLTSDVYAEDEIKSRVWMIIGEGSVFFLLLAVGIYHVRKSFKKEMRLNQQQKNFLLSVSHELKSPIASTKLFLQTLEKRDIDREKQKEIIEKAIKENDRLSGLVDNILTATQINESHYRLNKRDLNLSEFVEALIRELKDSIGKERQTKQNIAPSVAGKFDPEAMRSIIVNLYDNAVKYSDKGSSIQIDLRREDDSAILSISDEGVGIRAENRDLVFTKFYREGDESVRKSKGTGLGLFIVKHLVEMHSGTIKALKSKSGGATFELKFTLHQ